MFRGPKVGAVSCLRNIALGSDGGCAIRTELVLPPCPMGSAEFEPRAGSCQHLSCTHPSQGQKRTRFALARNGQVAGLETSPSVAWSSRTILLTVGSATLTGHALPGPSER